MADTREFSSSMSTPQSGSANLDITVNGTTTNYNPFGPNRTVNISAAGGETLLDGGTLEPQYSYSSDTGAYGVIINVPENHRVYECSIYDDNTHSDVTCGITIMLPELPAGVTPVVQIRLRLNVLVAADVGKVLHVSPVLNGRTIHRDMINVDGVWVTRNAVQYPSAVNAESEYMFTIIGDTCWAG